MNTNLVNQIARIMFIRKSQYDLANEFTMTKCAFVPGPAWKEEYQAWYDLSDEHRAEWVSAAELWLSTLKEKSPLTHSFISANFRNNLVTEETLDIL